MFAILVNADEHRKDLSDFQNTNGNDTQILECHRYPSRWSGWDSETVLKKRAYIMAFHRCKFLARANTLDAKQLLVTQDITCVNHDGRPSSFKSCNGLAQCCFPQQ